MGSFPQNPTWQCSLTEYITDLQWSRGGEALVATTAAGEVAIITDRLVEYLRSAEGEALETLAFSPDGQWLAAVGQEGKVLVWNWPQRELKSTLCQGNAWIDGLQWHPHLPNFAFSLGKYVQIWDIPTQNILHTIDFENSTVLALAWHPQGTWLTLSGSQGLKLWSSQDWFTDPLTFVLPTATPLIGWSQTGRFLAAPTMDGLVTILEWETEDFAPYPWRLQGFPGKIRSLAWWEDRLLVTGSGTEIVAWSQHPDPDIGWEPQILQEHTHLVTAMAFHPHQPLLAAGGEEGMVSLSQGRNSPRSQLLQAPAGITKLAWHPQGNRLAAGTTEGSVLIWKQATPGRGFGS